jgi:hypothetical protein
VRELLVAVMSWYVLTFVPVLLQSLSLPQGCVQPPPGAVRAAGQAGCTSSRKQRPAEPTAAGAAAASAGRAGCSRKAADACRPPGELCTQGPSDALQLLTLISPALHEGLHLHLVPQHSSTQHHMLSCFVADCAGSVSWASS